MVCFPNNLYSCENICNWKRDKGMNTRSLSQHRGLVSPCGTFSPNSGILCKPDQGKVISDAGEMGRLEANPAPYPVLSRAIYFSQEASKKILSTEKAGWTNSLYHPEALAPNFSAGPWGAGLDPTKVSLPQGQKQPGQWCRSKQSSLFPPSPSPHLIFGSYHSTGEGRQS